MDKNELRKRLEKGVKKLREENKIMVVEGNEDRKALEKLGLEKIEQLNKRPLFQIVEDLMKREKEVVILTDLDKKGKELYGKLKKDLQRFGVKVDDEFRNFLFRETKLRQIEGLDNYMKRLS